MPFKFPMPNHFGRRTLTRFTATAKACPDRALGICHWQDGGLVYAANSCRGELRCLKVADGTPVWSVNYTSNFSAAYYGERGNAQGATRHGNNGSPAIDGNYLYAPVGGTNGESVVCFEKTTGKVVWKSQNDEAAYAAPLVTVD